MYLRRTDDVTSAWHGVSRSMGQVQGTSLLLIICRAWIPFLSLFHCFAPSRTYCRRFTPATTHVHVPLGLWMLGDV